MSYPPEPQNQPGFIAPHGGYRELKSFQMSELVYDATVKFCDRFIDPKSRTHAPRSTPPSSVALAKEDHAPRPHDFRLQTQDVRLSTMYGMTNPVTEVTNRKKSPKK